MLTAKKRMKRKRFKRKTAVLNALEVLGFSPYGNSAKIVETAPVPVGDVRGCQKHPAGSRTGDVRKCTGNRPTHIHGKPCWWKMATSGLTTGAGRSEATHRILSAMSFF
jgi:hypothetical protein